jgi:hypothetical protein
MSESKLPRPQLVAQLHDCDAYEGTAEQVIAEVDERLCEARAGGLSRLRAAREANGEPLLSKKELKDLHEWQRNTPNFEAVVATLETSTTEIQAEIEWIGELHRHDKTGQACTDQKMLGQLKQQALQLAEATKKTAVSLNFGEKNEGEMPAARRKMKEHEMKEQEK